ncbi:fluoride efflux transporter FluC [Paenibacillus contaminans]|uniref:Fluoride-specific ion channel FluC n=1 Tax=Paenibacillus contaminans TaxID=450362 RepID=A0A329M5B9_9BACL|nr:CrcB family protein [Paenibacillus contaminans]RAV14842.1 fluoride efflux transporter CrcB [Paenibacillus contaminans]
MSILVNLALIAGGGACGAVSRFLLAGWLVRTFPMRFPIGTFVVNTLGSLLIGLLLGAGLEDTGWWFLLAVGFMGAFTTFSTFKYEGFTLLKSSDVYGLLFYLGGSYTLGIVLAWLGLWIGQDLMAGWQ